METKTAYITATWTVAPDTVRWDDLAAQCSVVVLPEQLRAHFLIDDQARLLVNAEPDVDRFLDLWRHLHRVQKLVQIAMGNALVYAQTKYGDDFAQELMEGGELSYYTYRQRMYVARNVPVENQDPTVSFSKLRAMAPAPPDVQRQLLDKIRQGELQNSPQVVAERKRIMREPPAETFDGPLYLNCPICGEQHTWPYDRLGWAECTYCHAHASELLDAAQARGQAIAQARRLLAMGDLGMVESY